MLKYLLLMVLVLVTSAEQLDPVSDQIVTFMENSKGPIGIMTTSAGAPIEKKDTSTLNKNLLSNEFFVDTMAHFTRERTPVRVVHPKGAGAFGYFKLTRDMSDISRAEFLCGVGKKTPVAVRLSLSFTERGGSDLTRETRGYAVKFYTEEGNFDIAGFNTPMFAVRDPSLFVTSVHVATINPVTEFKDANMLWDFITTRPESIFVFLIVFGDEGVPDGHRYMPGHSIHTYPLYNAAGKITLARFHFLPVGGVKYLNSTEAARLGALDPNYSARSIYDAIARGDYPTWEVFLQVMSNEKLKKTKIDPYDSTKVIPEDLFPYTKIGELVLNRSPKNHFAEVEQMAFCPGNLVPGILGSPDKLFEARRLFYRDAHNYRLGPNFDKIPVNFPYRSKVLSYNRDGSPPVGDNGFDVPNYYPNSFNGPQPYVDKNRPPVPEIYEAEPNNFEQARNYYTNQLVDDQRLRLVQNIVDSLCSATKFLQDRAIQNFKKVHSDLANRVAKGLKENKCVN